MPWRRQKTSAREELYTSAEDLCDPFEASDGDTADTAKPAKPRAHAVRLMDELDGEVCGSRRPDAPSESASLSPRGGTRASGRSSVRETFAETGMKPSANPTAHVPRAMETPPETPPEAPTILSVKPSGEGDVVAVVLRMPSEAEDSRSCERLRLYLLVEQYAELRPKEGSISRDFAEELLAAGRLCAAVKRGMQLLQYGDRSARRLAYRLTAKGIDRESAEQAVVYLTEKGYIHEDDTARLRARQGVRKLWGPRRIREDLRANGFTSDAITEAMESLAEVNFEESCAAVIRRKYRGAPTDRTERQKLMAALMRLGYDGDTIRAALRQIEREDG